MIKYIINSSFGMNQTNRFKIKETIKDSQTILLNNQFLDSIDLTEEYYTNHLNDSMIFSEYFSLRSGQEHYRLLTYLSMIFDNVNIFDIGTCGGASAFALSSNPNNTVYTFDIQDVHSKSLSDVNNIKFCIENILDNKEIYQTLLASPFIFLDTKHDGVFENEFYNFLVNNNYKGILGLDDIHLNDEMKNFWNNIFIKKYDVTKYGHGSGTGLVIFNDTQIIME